MALHVFVEGATDATPLGVARLAEAIAKHYGLPAADLHARLSKGRFRVKANADRATADQYCRDLQRLGARCVVEEANADNSQRSTPLPFPAVRPATPPVGSPTVAGRTPTAGAVPDVSRAATLPVTPRTPTVGGSPDVSRAATVPVTPRAPTVPVGSARTTTPPAGAYQSGLSAAFSGDMPSAGLGALEGDGATFSLSSVDGAEEQGPSAAAFEPPQSGLPASIGPAPDKPKAKAGKPEKPAKPKDEPLDMFAPPEAQGEELRVDIASDELEHSARKRASTPPPVEEHARPASQRIPRPHSEPAGRKSQPSIHPATEVAASSGADRSRGPLGDARTRFAAGVLIAVLVGFIPAHLVAGMREDSTFKEIDTKVMVAQQLADTPDAYATLDRMRADQLDRKEAEKRNAALIGFAIWGLVGAGVAFAWFKKIPWERLDA